MVHKDIWRDGVRMVSATELQSIIAKPFLDKWRIKLCHCKTHANAKKTELKAVEKKALNKFGIGHCGHVYADQVKDDAGDLGNDVHAIIEAWFHSGELKAFGSAEACEWAQKITEVYKEHNVNPVIIAPEEVLIDRDSNLCGSPDTIGEWDGRIEILDTKIKNSLDDLTAMQGCAYRYLIKRIHNIDIRWMRAVWCEKESKDHRVTPVVFDLDEWMDSWKALIKVWNKLHKKRMVTILE